MTKSPPQHQASDWPWAIPKPLFLVLAGMLMMVPPMTIDMIVPNLNAIADELGKSPSAVRQVVPFFFIGLGLGHFIWGPMSDRYGRRPALLGGMAVYGLASMTAFFAPSLEVLLGLRLLQGFGGASGFLLGRAILRDCFQGRELGWAISVSSGVFGAAPVLAPLLGWSVGSLLGWRATLGATTAYCLLMLLLVALVLPETRTKSRPLSASYLLGGVWRIVTTRKSRHYLILGVFVAALLPLMLSNLPNLFVNTLGVSRFAMTLILSASGLVLIAGQVVNARVIGRFGSGVACALGCFCIFAAAIVFGTLVAMGLFGVLMLAALALFFFSFYMIAFANVTAQVLDPHGDQIGLTAAFFGIATTSSGSAMTALTNTLVGSSVLSFTLVFLVFAVLVMLLSAWPLLAWRKG